MTGFDRSKLNTPIMDFASIVYLSVLRLIGKSYRFAKVTNFFTASMLDNRISVVYMVDISYSLNQSVKDLYVSYHNVQLSVGQYQKSSYFYSF